MGLLVVVMATVALLVPGTQGTRALSGVNHTSDPTRSTTPQAEPPPSRFPIGQNKGGYGAKVGQIASLPTYEDARRFAEGLAVVLIGSNGSSIDKTGQVVIPPTYERAGSVAEGVLAT